MFAANQLRTCSLRLLPMQMRQVFFHCQICRLSVRVCWCACLMVCLTVPYDRQISPNIASTYHCGLSGPRTQKPALFLCVYVPRLLNYCTVFRRLSLCRCRCHCLASSVASLGCMFMSVGHTVEIAKYSLISFCFCLIEFI